MASGSAAMVSQVLHALADLSPTTAERAPSGSIPTEWFRWIGLGNVQLLDPYARDTSPTRGALPDQTFAERLAALDQLRAGERPLRVGWLFVAGRRPDAPKAERRTFQPLVTVPVRVDRPLATGARLVVAGDVELTPLIDDPDVRGRLEREVGLGLGGGAFDELLLPVVPDALLARLDALRRCAVGLAQAAGYGATEVVSADRSPDAFLSADGLVIVAGVGVYAVEAPVLSGRGQALRTWADGDLRSWTALHSLYVDLPDAPPPPPVVPERVRSPLLLTPTQVDAVRSSRVEPVTVIAGAPGTGKSHTIAALACDALARGDRVLVAAKSDATVDALLDLLERVPGPYPVVFGSNERRQALADRVSSGQLSGASRSELDAAARRLDAATVDRDRARASVAERLRAEALLHESGRADEARLAAPGFFAPDADLDRALELQRVTLQPAKGWWSRRRARKAARALIEQAQPVDDLDLDAVVRALEVAVAVEASSRLVASGGLAIGDDWDDLRTRDDLVHELTGRWLALDARAPSRLGRSGRAAVAALATALRSGRGARRDQLARLTGHEPSLALPLWVGTLADIEDLLPPVPALFDLVVLDEASSIDQPLAAPALLRGRRAVVVGDPHQLRHVSFLADARVAQVLASRGLDAAPALAARLDTRRNSVFDVAAGTAPVLTLGEHFRSDPHLVDFVAQRIYDGFVTVATRSPRTESSDCIEVVRVDGRRDADEVVTAEVDAVVAQLRDLHAGGASSVGVVTPFRAQADALEAAVLDRLTLDEISALDLRMGTVHSFQGNERDVIIASMGIDPTDAAGSWRFVQDPHLFTVFVTRARRRFVVVTSAEPPAGGLVADYFAQVDTPPGPPVLEDPDEPWRAGLAGDLDLAGLVVRRNYPVGRHTVDLCVGDAAAFFAVETGVHPLGPDAHIDRHLALRRLGWELREAYPSRWADRRAELVVELSG